MLWSVPTKSFAVQKYTVTVDSEFPVLFLSPFPQTLSSGGPVSVPGGILPWIISCCFPFSFSPAADHYSFFKFLSALMAILPIQVGTRLFPFSFPFLSSL